MVPASRFPSAPNRREFFRAAAAAAAALSLPRLARAAGTSEPLAIVGCAESFKFLQPHELAQFASVVGWSGLEASVKDGGHIDPTHVRDDLPDFYNSVQSHGLDVPVVSTDLVSMRNPAAEGVLRTAAKLGIRHVTLGNWKYYPDRPRDPQLAIMVRDLRDLGQLAAELKIALGIENSYRADRFGWDVKDLLEIIQASGQNIGLCFNPARAILVHGGASEQAALAQPHLSGAYAEDFLPRSLSTSSAPKPCVLGMGVSQPAYFRGLRSSGFNAPVCLRYEYKLGSNAETLAHARTDLATLQQWLGQFVASPFL